MYVEIVAYLVVLLIINQNAKCWPSEEALLVPLVKYFLKAINFDIL